MKRTKRVVDTGWMRAGGRKAGVMKPTLGEFKRPDDQRGLTPRQWAIVAAAAIGAIFWVFVVSPQSNYLGPTGTFFVSAEGEPPLILRPDSQGYSAARAELEDFQADAPGTYNVSLNTYLNIKAALGLSNDTDEEARLARWNERTEHWSNLRAFLSSTKASIAGGAVDEAEAERICAQLPHWQGQLAAAQAYVAKYRTAEPATVQGNPVLQDLESEATRGLALLSQFNCTKPIATLK